LYLEEKCRGLCTALMRVRLETGQVAEFGGFGSEIMGYVKCGEFLDKLRTC